MGAFRGQSAYLHSVGFKPPLYIRLVFKTHPHVCGGVRVMCERECVWRVLKKKLGTWILYIMCCYRRGALLCITSNLSRSSKKGQQCLPLPQWKKNYQHESLQLFHISHYSSIPCLLGSDADAAVTHKLATTSASSRPTDREPMRVLP